MQSIRSAGSRGVLLVGKFSSSTNGFCAELAGRLSQRGWRTLTTSAKRGRIQRAMDMLSMAWQKRHEYCVAQIDVYGSAAFAWAETTSCLLRRLRKPYVLTLHGGSLPEFGRRWPGRLRRLLGPAAEVTTPSRYLQDQLQAYRLALRLLPNARDLTACSFRLR